MARRVAHELSGLASARRTPKSVRADHQMSPSSPPPEFRGLGNRHRQLDLEMGKAVTHGLRQRLPSARRGRMSRGLRQAPRFLAPGRGGQLDHYRRAGRSSGRRRRSTAPSPRVSQKETTVAQRARPLGRAARQRVSAMPPCATLAGMPPGAGETARIARRADGRAEIHQGPAHSRPGRLSGVSSAARA